MNKILKIYDHEIIELQIPENSTFIDISVYYEYWLENRLLDAGFNFIDPIEKYMDICGHVIVFWQKGDSDEIC